MTQQEFYNNLNNSKTSFLQKETTELNSIVAEFPYFQAASFILMKALYINNDIQYKTKLAHTAANISNRESLFNFIYSEYSIKNNSKENASPSKPLNTTIRSSKEITQPKALQNKEGQEIKSKADLIKDVKDRLDEGERKKEKGEREKEKGERRKEKEKEKVEEKVEEKEKGERRKEKVESIKEKEKDKDKEKEERRKEKGESIKEKEKEERLKAKVESIKEKEKEKGERKKEKGERRRKKGERRKEKA